MKTITVSVFFLCIFGSVHADEWRLRPGQARDIAVGANGSTWIIGNTATGGGFTIHHWTGTAWELVNGGGVRIAVDPKGKPWIINNTGRILRREGNLWLEITGAFATDICISPVGNVWIVSTTPAGANGLTIQTMAFGSSGGGWQTIPGAGERIAVSPNGNPWIVDRNKNIFERLTDGSWKRYPGEARDIAIGANGAVWVIGNIPRSRSFSIHFWNSSEWVEVDGGGTQIAVEAHGAPWIINDRFEIYQRAYTNNNLRSSLAVTPVSMNYLMGGRVSSIFVNPGNGNHVVAVGETGGIFETLNFLSAGRRWIHQTQFREHEVTDVLLVPSGSGMELWATSKNSYKTHAKPLIWKRVAGGAWQQASFSASSPRLRNEIEANTYRIVKSKINNDLYAIGAFGVAYKPQSTDEWTIVSTRTGFVSLETMSNGNLVAAGSTSLQYSTDNGQNWTPANITLSGASLPFWNSDRSQKYCLKSDLPGNIILACTRADVMGQMQLYGSTDMGQNWQAFRTLCGLINSRSGTGGYESVLPLFNTSTNQLELYISNTENIHYGYAPGSNAVNALSAAMINTAFPWLPGSGYADGKGFNGGHEDTRQVAIIPNGSGRKMLITSDGGLHVADLTSSNIHTLTWNNEGTGTGLNVLQIFNITGTDREWMFGSMDNSWGFCNRTDLREWTIGGGREGIVINRRGVWAHNYMDHTLLGVATMGRFSGTDFTRITDQCPASPGSNNFNSPLPLSGTPVWFGHNIFIQDVQPGSGSSVFPWKISKDNGCSWQDIPPSRYARAGGSAEATFISIARQASYSGGYSYNPIWLTTAMQSTLITRDVILGRLENPGGISFDPVTQWKYPLMRGLNGGIAVVGKEFLSHPVFCVNPADPNQIFAVEKSTGKLKVSTTAGDLWDEVTSFNNLYAADEYNYKSSLGDQAIWCLGISPFDPQLILAGTVTNGIFLSMNGGNSWSRLPHQGIFMPTSFFWRTPTEVLVSTYGRGLFKINF